MALVVERAFHAVMLCVFAIGYAREGDVATLLSMQDEQVENALQRWISFSGIGVLIAQFKHRMAGKKAERSSRCC